MEHLYLTDKLYWTGSIHCNDPRSVTNTVRGWSVFLWCPAAFRLSDLATGVLLHLVLHRSTESKLVRRRQSLCELVGNLDWQSVSACLHFILVLFLYRVLSSFMFHWLDGVVLVTWIVCYRQISYSDHRKGSMALSLDWDDPVRMNKLKAENINNSSDGDDADLVLFCFFRFSTLVLLSACLFALFFMLYFDLMLLLELLRALKCILWLKAFRILQRALNTLQGSEVWNSKTSNLLQVLISIQGLCAMCCSYLLVHSWTIWISLSCSEHFLSLVGTESLALGCL